MMRSLFVAGTAVGLLAAGALTATAGSSHRTGPGDLASITTLTRVVEVAQAELAQVQTETQVQTQTEAQTEAQAETQDEDTDENDDVGEEAENGAAAQAAPTTVQAPTSEADDQAESGGDD